MCNNTLQITIRCVSCSKELSTITEKPLNMCCCPNGTFIQNKNDRVMFGGIDPFKIELWDSKLGKFIQLK